MTFRETDKNMQMMIGTEAMDKKEEADARGGFKRPGYGVSIKFL